jgi:hypothetical protein
VCGKHRPEFLKAMEVYAKSKEIDLRKELVNCINWIDKSTYWKEDNDIPNEFIIDEYLKQR